MKKILRVLYSPSSILFVLMSAFYFLSRVVYLKSVSIFVDEAAYIHWAQLGAYDPQYRLISLSDGKQPLFVWIIIAFLRVFHDPLIAGRITAVFSGFAACIGLILLTYELFKNKWIALLAMFLYVISPYSILFNRLALYESLVGAFALWSMYLSILLVRRLQLVNALLLAFSLGGGILNKTTGYLSIYLLPLTLLLFDYKKKKLVAFGKWLYLASIAIFVALMYSLVLRLSPDYSRIASKDSIFIQNPVYLFFHEGFLPTISSNTHSFSLWLLLLFTPLFLVFLFIGLSKAKKFLREMALLVSTFLIEILFLTFLGKDPYPRYLFPMIVYLFPIVAFGIWQAYIFFGKKIVPFVLLLIVIVSFPLFSDFKIITNIEKAPVPALEKEELVTGWQAGTGMDAIIAYLREQSQNHKILVITDGSFGGMVPVVLDVYLSTNPHIERMTFGTFPDQMPNNIFEKTRELPVFLIVNQTKVPPWKMNGVLEYRKGHGSSYIRVYRLTPNSY